MWFYLPNFCALYIDLANRDYTLNAIACRIYNQDCKIIDPFNGKDDIENRIIKAISEKNIIDDPLRILRGFRLAAQFGFNIEKRTLELITRHNKLINNVSVERINAELVKLFDSQNTSETLFLMKETDFLFEIFPELISQKKIPPNSHHHLWLIDHSIETVKQTETELKKFPVWAKKHIFKQFSTNTRLISLIKIAALLHDIGKPDTWTIDEQGRHRFIKHEEIGAQQVVVLLKRLKFSKNASNYISLLIKNHLYPSQLIREDKISEKALIKFFRRIGDNVPELLLLALADRLSARGPEITDEMIEKNINGTYALLDKYKKTGEKLKKIPKLVSGKDVMKILNIPECPDVGNILKELKEAQILGDINTRSEAVEFIKNFNLQK